MGRVMIPSFSHYVKKSWIEMRNIIIVLTEGKAEFSNFRGVKIN